MKIPYPAHLLLLLTHLLSWPSQARPLTSSSPVNFLFGLDQSEPCPQFFEEGAPIDASELAGVLSPLPSFLEEKRVRLKAFSSVLSIVQGGSLLFHTVAGSEGPSESSPNVTLRSKYCVGSVSKIFTSLMLFQLRDQGLLPQGLDTAVSDILPGWVDPPLAQPSHLSGVQRRRAASTRSLTLRALATHSSGLVREVPPCDNCTEIQRLAAIAANTSRLFPMYARTLYSNLGIAVLGRALEKVAGKTWEEWVESEIMKPLAMADSGAKCTSDVPGVVIGADPASGKAIPAPGDWDWGAPCGSVYTSAADMTRFMNFLLGFEPSEASTPSSPSPSSSSSSSSSAPTVLDPSSLAEMQRIVFAQRDGISGVASGTFEGAVMEVDQPEGVGKMRGGLFQRSTADIGGGATKDRTVRYWSLSKLGCIEGFRAAFTLVPSLSLGVFAAVGSTCDMYGDGDVISFPVTNALLDGVGQLLRAREEQRAKRLPGKEQVGDYLGQYDCG
eukprot:jgi/Bigna1/145580/aug1.101_g20288